MKMARTDKFRLGGVFFFLLVASIFYFTGKQGNVFPLLLAALFAGVHLLFSRSQRKPAQKQKHREVSHAPSNSDMTAAPQQSDMEANSTYRDIVKQYVATAGTILGLVVAFFSGSFPATLLLACTSLAISICCGLLLLEAFSGGSIVPARAHIVSNIYHVQTWTLALGIFGLVSSVWST